MTDSQRKTFEIGQILRVEIEKIAHGGHFIARHEGAVIFVRHAIPGELVEVKITGIEKSLIRGDVIAVIEASPSRVKPPCRFAHAGGCGGCDFQHIDIDRQRALKSEVIAEQFARIAKMEVEVEVEEVSTPLHWRTRYAATTSTAGELGFKAASSTKVIAIDSCPVLIPEIDFPTLPRTEILAGRRVDVALSTRGERIVGVSQLRSARIEQNHPIEIIEGRKAMFFDVATSFGESSYQVSQGSFWQSNINAPAALIEAVLEYADLSIGDHLLDLYGGVGLFAAAALPLIGESGKVDLVEASSSATRDAAQNFRSVTNVAIHTVDVAKALRNFESADVVLLDPPRTGAGAEVIERIVDLAPRSIVYIACDPAALARDTGYLRALGFHLRAIRAFDLFPMTHHVESVALFTADEVS
jgi:tRNA/tmRNA/rRNA uracil-C5-methylase (TrmA/RlmC/RlmD family)